MIEICLTLALETPPIDRNRNRGILYWVRKADELETQNEIIERSKNEEISVLREELEEMKECHQEQISDKNEETLKVRMRLVKSIRENKQLARALDKVKQDNLKKDEEIRRLRTRIEDGEKDKMLVFSKFAQESAQKNLRIEDLEKKILQLESQMNVEQKKEGCQIENLESEGKKTVEAQPEDLQEPKEEAHHVQKSIEKDVQVAKNRKRPTESMTDCPILIKFRTGEYDDEPMEEDDEVSSETADVSVPAANVQKQIENRKRLSEYVQESESDMDSETKRKIDRVAKKLKMDIVHSKLSTRRRSAYKGQYL